MRPTPDHGLSSSRWPAPWWSIIAAVYEAAGVVWAVVLFLVALIAQLLFVLRKRGPA